MAGSHIIELHIASVCMMPAYTNDQVHPRLHVLPVFMDYQVHLLFMNLILFIQALEGATNTKLLLVLVLYTVFSRALVVQHEISSS